MILIALDIVLVLEIRISIFVICTFSKRSADEFWYSVCQRLLSWRTWNWTLLRFWLNWELKHKTSSSIQVNLSLSPLIGGH